MSIRRGYRRYYSRSYYGEAKMQKELTRSAWIQRDELQKKLDQAKRIIAQLWKLRGEHEHTR